MSSPAVWSRGPGTGLGTQVRGGVRGSRRSIRRPHSQDLASPALAVFLRRSLERFRTDAWRRERHWKDVVVLLSQLGAADTASIERLAAGGETPEASVLRRAAAALVTQALMCLSDENRRLFLLRYQEGWSCKELADRFGMKEPAVRQRLRWIRQRLRREMTEADPAGDAPDSEGSVAPSTRKPR